MLVNMSADFSTERPLFGGAIVSTFPLRFQVVFFNCDSVSFPFVVSLFISLFNSLNLYI